jgi:hypothetical protein
MGVENVSDVSGTGGGSTPPNKSAGDLITADTFRQMLDVLESLQSHNHIFYDDYTTVCECQCQCQCSRGTF